MYFVIYMFILLAVYIATFSADFDTKVLEKASPFIAICVILIIVSLMFTI